jgi:hypothetical protein
MTAIAALAGSMETPLVILTALTRQCGARPRSAPDSG